MNRRAWVFFWLLGTIWGSSFLLIRIGVQEFLPGEVVFIRTAIAAVGLNILLLLRGKRLPSDRRILQKLAIIGIGNTVVPFMLISWGEQSIDSGLASVLQATASLFTLVIAHFAFADERINMQRVMGLIVGFVGVMVLASRDFGGGEVLTNGLLGQMAMVLASLFYAMFTTYSRKVIHGNVEPIIISAGAMTSAAIVSGVLLFGASLVGGPSLTPLTAVSTGALVAVFLLGLLNTFFAYIFFYYIVQELGAARASMVTYIVPAVGLILGVVVADEIMDIKLILGAMLIFSGIGIVNVRLARRRNVSPAAAPAE